MKNKLIFYTCILLTLEVNATTTGSLFFNKIYDAGTSKPVTAGSGWKAFSINGEKTKISFTEDHALSIKTEEKSAFVYMVPAENIGMSAFPCTMETAIQTSGENAGMDMDIRTPDGKRLSVEIRDFGLIDRMTNDTVYFGSNHSYFSIFRFAFDDKKMAKIYRNGQLLLTKDCISGDEIKNPGFEQNNSIDPMWWCSDWSQLTIDGNNPYNGNKSLHWENGWTGQLGAKIPVQPNAKYRLTFWAKAVRINAAQTAMKGALWINGENKGSLDIPIGDYRKLSIDFNTANFDEIAEIIFHNGWNDSDAGAFAIYIDDLELNRLESPSYTQFGKINPSEKREFILNYIAVKTGEELSPLLYRDLTEIVSQAKALKSEATAGTQPGNYPVYAIDRLTEKMEKADTLTVDSEYMLIDASYAQLEREINRFRKCCITNPALEFATLEITPLITGLKLTEQIRINVSGTMSDGHPIDPEILYINYLSVNKKISVDETGLITAIDTGTDEIIITVQYINALKTIKLPVEITPYEIIRVEAKPYRSTIELGDATGIQTAAFMTGNEKADETRVSFSFQSLSPGIAEINDYGTIIAKAPGTAEIRVTGCFGGKKVSEVFNVNIITAARIEIDVPEEIKAGETHKYAVKAYYTDGSQTKSEEKDIIVFSNDRNILRADNQGMLEATNEGKAVFSARFRQGKTEIVGSEILQIGSSQQLHSQNPDTLFRFYPNPVSDRIFIDCLPGAELYKIKIISLTGKTIFSHLPSGINPIRLNLHSLSRGVYFITLTGKNMEIVRKLIKL